MPDSIAPAPAEQSRPPESDTIGAPLKHDARTGFRDIKPIPEFSPVNIPLIVGALLLLLVLFGARYWLRKRRELALLPPPPPSPEKIALQELTQLLRSWEQRQIALRELSHKLSLTLRIFLEATLKFPASESTVREISSELPRALARFRTGSQLDKDKLGAEIIELLKQCDRLSFSAQTEAESENYQRGDTVQTSGNSVPNTVKRIEVIVRTVVRWLAAEQVAIKHAEAATSGLSVTGNDAV